MPDPFVKRQAKENQEAKKAITAESFRAKEAQSLTKSIGTAGKPLVEPRQKEDKVTTTTFTPSVDMSSDRDDDKSKTIATPTTATYKYTEPPTSQMSTLDKWFYKFSKGIDYNTLDKNQKKVVQYNYNRSFYDTIFNPISSRKVSEEAKQIILNPQIADYQTELREKGFDVRDALTLLNKDPEFKKEFSKVQNERAILERKTSENRIRNSFYDTFVNKFGLSPRTSEILTGVVDFTPIIGDATGFEDAIINYRSGRYGAAAFDGALATIGLAPVAGDAIRKTLNGVNIEDIAPRLISYRGRKKVADGEVVLGEEIPPKDYSFNTPRGTKKEAIKDWEDFVDAEGLTPYLNKANIENPNIYDPQKLDIIQALPSFPTRLKLLTIAKLDDLWVKHGWNPGAKGRFFTEIDDSQAILLDKSSFIKDFHTDRIPNLERLGEFELEKVLYHSELFEIYPELRDMKISWKSLDPRTGGHYDPSKKEVVLNQDVWKKLRDAREGSKEDIAKINDQLMDLVIHEVQHAIQDIEGVGGFSRYLVQPTYRGADSYDVTRRIENEIKNDQFKIDNMLDPRNTVTNKEDKIKNLQKKILANKFKLDNFLSRLSFTRKIKRTFSPELDDLTDAEFVSGYYRQYNELEARLAEDRIKMKKRFLQSPYRDLRSFDAGYSGFDILSQASKNEDGIIDVEKYDQFVSEIYDGIKSFVRKNKKFNADNSFRDITGIEMTPESEANLINNFFYQFVYKKKQAQNVVIHKDLISGGFAGNFDSQLNRSVREVYDGVDPAEYIRKLFEDHGEVADFSDLEKINDTLYDLFKKQVVRANDEIVDRTLGVAQRGVDVWGELNSPQEFYEFLVEMEELSPSYTDTLFASGRPRQKDVGDRLNVPESEQTPFDDTYTAYRTDNKLDVDPIPSISGPTKNISTNPASPLEIGVNKFNVDNIENPMLIKNYTKSNLIETEEFVKNSNKSTAGGGAKDFKINVPVEEGSDVAVRLNLSSRIDNTIKEIKDKPNLSNRLQTIHPVKNGVPDYKRSQSYMPYVTVENGKFDVNQNNRSKIVKTGDKNPAASVLGKYTTSRNIFDEMDDTVVEIGINPKMLHLFVNLKTGQAVKDFELATIFRDRVYAKGVTYWKKVEAPEPTQGTSSEVRYANKKGGLI
jgi:hypothetical protein